MFSRFTFFSLLSLFLCPWASERFLYVKCIVVACNYHESNGTYVHLHVKFDVSDSLGAFHLSILLTWKADFHPSFFRCLDLDQRPPFWHHQALGPGSQRPLPGQHLLQSPRSRHRNRTVEHDPQPRGLALRQGCPACGRQQLLERRLHLLTTSLRMWTTRWTSRPRTSPRTCPTARSTPWTVITRTSSWWRRIRTDPGPPAR